MEKKKPHYDLKILQRLFNAEATRTITVTAQKGAAALGYMNEDDIAEVIGKLCSQHFYKSMTRHQKSQIWQDVYKFKDEEKNLYIKLQLSIDKKQTILIQFKQDGGGED
ncbi:MAG: type II toxin-antitoxin system MqsR family toxin [Nitrospirota bacterium]